MSACRQASVGQAGGVDAQTLRVGGQPTLGVPQIETGLMARSLGTGGPGYFEDPVGDTAVLADGGVCSRSWGCRRCHLGRWDSMGGFKVGRTQTRTLCRWGWIVVVAGKLGGRWSLFL